jgi:peptide/nickel transport system substrate-binding protein
MVWAAIIAVIVVVAAIVGAVYYTSIQTPSSTEERLLRVGFCAPAYIDPAVGTDDAGTACLTNLYDPLLFPKPVTGEPQPWLAKSWTTTQDGLVWTFALRNDVKFHSGRTMNATDVAFSMNRLLTMGSGFAFIYNSYISSVVAIDEYTVRFTLNQTFAPLLGSLAHFYILDSEQVLTHTGPGAFGTYGDYGGTWLTTHDAGSGPYTATDVSMNDHIYMAKFKDYWGPIASNTATLVQFIMVGGTPTEKAMMQSKELDLIMIYQPEEAWDIITATPGINSTKIDIFQTMYVMLNTKKAPTDDVNVRKALAYAFDYQTMVTDIIDRPLLKTCVAPGLQGAVQDSPYYQNLTLAQEYLQKSKYWPDIHDHPENYKLELHWTAETPVREKIILLLAQNVQEIGLQASVTKVPWLQVKAEMAQLATSPTSEITLTSPDYSEAGSQLASRYSSKTAGTWQQNEWLQDPAFDANILDALSTLNNTERMQKYAQLQQYIMDICPSIFLYEETAHWAYWNYVVFPPGQGQYSPLEGYNWDARVIQILPH